MLGSLLLKSELRDLKRNPLNTFFVTLSLSIGVMSVLVIHELSTSIVERFEANGPQGAYDYIVYLPTQTEREYFELRRRWRAGSFPDVTHMVPVVEGLVNVNGTVYDVLGYDPAATLPTRTMEIAAVQADPRFMTQFSVVAIGGNLRKNDLVHGALVLNHSEGSSPRLLADLPSAQRLLAKTGEINAVWLRTQNVRRPWWDNLVPGLSAAARSTATGFTLSNYTVLPFTWWNPSQELGDAIVFNLGMLSLLTLLVAGFIVFQATQSNIRQRTRQAELLDSMGCSELMQRVLVSIQCTSFGVLGCVLGVLFSVALLGVIFDTNPLATWREMSAVGIAKATGLGFATTVIVGLAVNRNEGSNSSLVSWAASGLALVGLLYGLHEDSGLLGASLLSVCFCILSVFCVTPLAVRGALVGIRQLQTNLLVLRMDLRNTVETIQDIRLALNALSIAVATAIGIGLMLVSFRGEFIGLLDQRLASDLHVSNAAGLDIEALKNRDDVLGVRSYYRGETRMNGIPVQVVAAELDAFERKRYGYPGTAKVGVLVNERAARRHELSTGDLVLLDIAVDALPILHIFKDYGEPNSRIVVPSDAVELDNLVADRYSVDASDPQAVRLAIASRHPAAQIVNSNEIREQAIRIFDASFATAQIMVNVAIFVAVIGMASALFGLQAKRLREMRLLTMMGFSRPKLQLHAVVQNGLIGLFAVVVALPLSFAIAWNLCYHVNPRAYGWTFDLTFTWLPIALPSSLGIAAAILAGLEPMRRTLNRVISQPIVSVT
ncbi:MAG: ABC transporter permease [Gammaproteobacteria bacterium]|nr:ABC transporter permease [Gammaproteobacteria bacterium]